MHRVACTLVVAAAILSPIPVAAQPGGLPDVPRRSFGLIEVGASRVAFIQADAWVERGRFDFRSRNGVTNGPVAA